MKDLSREEFVEFMRHRDLVETSQEIMPYLQVYSGVAIHHVSAARNGLDGLLRDYDAGTLNYKTFHDLLENECSCFTSQLMKYLHESGKAGAFHLK